MIQLRERESNIFDFYNIIIVTKCYVTCEVKLDTRYIKLMCIIKHISGKYLLNYFDKVDFTWNEVKLI